MPAQKFLLCLAVLPFIFPPAQYQPGNYELTGHITDQETGLPLEGSRLTLFDATTGDTLVADLITNAEGRYNTSFPTNVQVEFLPVPPGAYTVSNVAPHPAVPGQAPMVLRYTTPGNRPEAATLELFDVLGRRVLPDASLAAGVYFYRLRFEGDAFTETHTLVLAQGGLLRFEMEPAFREAVAAKALMTEIEVRCVVQKAGYAPVEEHFMLDTETTTTHDFALVRSAAHTILVGDAVGVAVTQVSPEGGTVTVAAQGSPVDGLAIEVPPGAYDEDRTFSVSYVPLEDHALGPYFHPATPLIRIENGGGYAEEGMRVWIPVAVPDDAFAMAFLYDETTGTLEGLPLLARSDSGLTVATRHFGTSGATRNGRSEKRREASAVGTMLVSSIEASLLAEQPVIDTGFRVGFDDWEFGNWGSKAAPMGHATGQTLSAAWYYFERTLHGAPPLTMKFARGWNEGLDFLGVGDPAGYRLASVLEQEAALDASQRLFSGLTGPTTGTLQWNAFIYSMLLTGEPQFVGLYGQERSHALLAYLVGPANGTLLVADPNQPGEPAVILYEEGMLGPYETVLYAGAPDVTAFSDIRYLAKTSLLDWDQIGERWAEFEAGTVGNGLFPDYSLRRLVLPHEDLIAALQAYAQTLDPATPLPDGPEVELTDEFEVAQNYVVLGVRCPACVQPLAEDKILFYPFTEREARAFQPVDPDMLPEDDDLGIIPLWGRYQGFLLKRIWNLEDVLESANLGIWILDPPLPVGSFVDTRYVTAYAMPPDTSGGSFEDAYTASIYNDQYTAEVVFSLAPAGDLVLTQQGKGAYVFTTPRPLPGQSRMYELSVSMSNLEINRGPWDPDSTLSPALFGAFCAIDDALGYRELEADQCPFTINNNTGTASIKYWVKPGLTRTRDDGTIENYPNAFDLILLLYVLTE